MAVAELAMQANLTLQPVVCLREENYVLDDC